VEEFVVAAVPAVLALAFEQMRQRKPLSVWDWLLAAGDVTFIRGQLSIVAGYLAGPLENIAVKL